MATKRSVVKMAKAQARKYHPELNRGPEFIRAAMEQHMSRRELTKAEAQYRKERKQANG